MVGSHAAGFHTAGGFVSRACVLFVEGKAVSGRATAGNMLCPHSAAACGTVSQRLTLCVWKQQCGTLLGHVVHACASVCVCVRHHPDWSTHHAACLSQLVWYYSSCWRGLCAACVAYGNGVNVAATCCEQAGAGVCCCRPTCLREGCTTITAGAPMHCFCVSV